MPRSELITDICKNVLQLNIEAALSREDEVNGKGITTPIPLEYFSREIDESMIVNYPACKISYLRFSKVDDDIWRHYLNIEFYQVNSDQNELEAQIKRIASAAEYTLSRESNWGGYGYNPEVRDGFISGVLPVESGFLRACRLQFNIDTIKGE